uniref:Glycosyltransferase 2-like domain-containing protein n=1 Tax=Acrobeloides nanus TaxID=290746 RepID=A0A914DD61_9BILA
MSSNKVAVIIPVKNGASFLGECLQSILEQDFTNFQVCIFDDGSTDTTPEIIDKFSIRFIQRGIDFRHKREHTSRGVGYAKNQAVELSDAPFICFCDADDLALRDRVRIQYEECLRMPEPENCLLGSFFCRVPDGSTSRFTSWACKLNESQLYTQNL